MNLSLLAASAVVLVVSGSAFLATTLSARARRLTADASGSSWSIDEIIKVLTSLAGLITGAILPLLAALQGRKSADALQTELNAVRDSNRRLVRFELRTWEKLPQLPVADSGVMRVDDRDATTRCDGAKRVVAYDGTGPAKLHCAKGAFQIQLSTPTVLLMVPDTLKPK